MNLPIIETCLKIVAKKVHHNLLNTTTTHLLLCAKQDEYDDTEKL